MKRERYETPVLRAHRFQPLNKFVGVRESLQALSAIGTRPVRDLVARFGSPLYVYSAETLASSQRAFALAFGARFADARVAYSYKACPLPGVAATLHRAGAWAQIGSPVEALIARRLGVPARETILWSVAWPDEALAAALADGAWLVVETPEDVERVRALAPRVKGPGRVLLRVWVPTSVAGAARCGFDPTEAEAAARTLAGTKGLRLAGLACHLGTTVLDPYAYRIAAATLAGLAGHLARTLGVEIEILDLGGGFPSTKPLLASPAGQVAPGLDVYADACAQGLLAWPHGLRLPAVVVEPGRALVDDAGTILTTVVSTKRSGGGRKFAIIDAGVHLLPTAYWYRHDILPTAEEPASPEDVGVYGPLCMQIDCLSREVRLPPLVRGTLLAIRRAGAYSISQSMQFIFPRPAAVLVDGDDVVPLLEAEDARQIRGLDVVPRRLELPPNGRGRDGTGKGR